MISVDLVAPDPKQFISGGNIYNEVLISTLRESGVKLTRHEPQTLSQSGADVVLVDSIYLDQFNPEPSKTNICLIHHLNSLYPRSLAKFEKEERHLLNPFDAFIVTSKFMHSQLQVYGYAHVPISIIEPVAPKIIRTSGPPPSKLRALMLANIVERKGIREFLLELSLAQIQPTYKINIIGDLTMDQPYARECQQIVRDDKNLTKAITFMGTQDEAVVAELLSTSNLFISTAFMETFGMSIQEAAVYGLPLIVHEGGYAQYHVSQGINGWSYRSMAEIAKKVGELAHNIDLLQEITASTEKFAPNYSWDVENISRQFKELIGILRAPID